MTNRSVGNQVPDNPSLSMEVIFALRIDGLYFKPTWSIILSISQRTMPLIYCLGLFSCLNFGINIVEQLYFSCTYKKLPIPV